MRALLERAGFRIRSSKRADCAHCRGNSTGSVSYTGTVAYCHRCHWSANRRQLEQGICSPQGSPPFQRRGFSTAREKSPGLKTRATQRATGRAAAGKITPREEAQALNAAFHAWLIATLAAIGMRERQLEESKRRASACLLQRLYDPVAWDALMAICDQLDWLDMLWDFLTCARLSCWFNPPTTADEVFRCWHETQALTKDALA